MDRLTSPHSLRVRGAFSSCDHVFCASVSPGLSPTTCPGNDHTGLGFSFERCNPTTTVAAPAGGYICDLSRTPRLHVLVCMHADKRWAERPRKTDRLVRVCSPSNNKPSPTSNAERTTLLGVSIYSSRSNVAVIRDSTTPKTIEGLYSSSLCTLRKLTKNKKTGTVGNEGA